MNFAEMLEKANQATEGVVDSTPEYSPIPAGTYSVAVTACEIKDSRRANPNNPSEFGKYLNITLSVVDGAHTGRLVFAKSNILVYPASLSDQDIIKAQKAMVIGSRERNIIMESKGITTLKDPSDLIGGLVSVDVVIETGMDGKNRNVVKRIKSASSATVQQKPVQQVQSTSVPTSATASAPAHARRKMPWEK